MFRGWESGEPERGWSSEDEGEASGEPGDERAASGGQDSGGKGGGATLSSGVKVGKWEKGIVATTAADVCRVSQPCGDFQLAAVGRRSAQSAGIRDSRRKHMISR